MPLLVTGAPGSGGERLARMLAALGVDAGGNRLPDEEDPRAPWEAWTALDARELNDAILREAGGSWLAPAAVEVRSIDPGAHERLTADIAALSKSRDRSRPWLVHDPRLAWTLPLWAASLPDAVPVLAHRHPACLLNDLCTLLNAPAMVALAWWEHHAAAWLAGTQDRTRLVVDLDRLCKTPEEQAQDLCRRLGQAGVSTLGSPQAPEVAGALDGRMPLSCAGPANTPLTANQQRILDALDALADGRQEPAAPASADHHATALLAAWCDQQLELEQLDRAVSDASAARRETAQATADARTSQTRHEDLAASSEKEHDQLRTELQTLSQERQAELAQLEGRLAEARTEVERRAAAQATLTSERDARAAELHALARERDALDARTATMVQELEALQQEHAALITLRSESGQRDRDLTLERDNWHSKADLAVARSQDVLNLAAAALVEIRRMGRADGGLHSALLALNALSAELRAQRSQADRHHQDLWEILRLRDRVIRKEQAIQRLRKWHAARALSLPATPAALRAQVAFRRWNTSFVHENIKPLPETLDTLREEAEQRTERDQKRWTDLDSRFHGALAAAAGGLAALEGQGAVAKLHAALVAADVTLPEDIGKGAASAPPPPKPIRRRRRGRPRARHPVVVYTAIAGEYDPLREPTVPQGCDLVCFTDRGGARAGSWNLQPFDYHNADPTRMARYVKTHPHIYFPDHEWSVWIDANLLVKTDLASLISTLPDDTVFAAYRHPHRDCVFEEAEEIVARGGLDNPAVVRAQAARYREQAHPTGAGLTETNVLVRRHGDARCVRLMNAWWKEIDNGSRRDQLSIDVVARREDVTLTPLAPLGTSVRNDPRFERFLHGEGAQRA